MDVFLNQRVWYKLGIMAMTWTHGIELETWYLGLKVYTWTHGIELDT